MKIVLSLMILGMLAGCASLRPEFLENRVLCTIDQSKAFVLSQWGWVGISASIAEADREVICKGQRSGS